jgi:hypothetical protein
VQVHCLGCYCYAVHLHHHRQCSLLRCVLLRLARAAA